MATEEHPWWGRLSTTVIGGLIVGLLLAAILGSIYFFYPNTAATFFSSIAGACRYLAEPILVARWFLWFLKLISGGVVVALLWSLLRLFFNPSLPPAHYQYTSDRFLGFKWRWSWPYWYATTPNLDTIAAFCAKCDTRLAFQYEEYPQEHVIYECETCDEKWRLGGTGHQIALRVARQIERAVNSGDWRNHLREPLA
jgi:hypothetical protein